MMENHTTINDPNRIESLVLEYFRRAVEIDEQGAVALGAEEGHGARPARGLALAD
jgi:hypothetical protein